MKQLRTPVILALLCCMPLLRLIAGGGFVPVAVNPLNLSDQNQSQPQAGYQLISPFNNDNIVVLEEVTDQIRQSWQNLEGYEFTGEIIQNTLNPSSACGNCIYVPMYTNVPRWKEYRPVNNLPINDIVDNVILEEAQLDNVAMGNLGIMRANLTYTQYQVDNVVVDNAILNNFTDVNIDYRNYVPSVNEIPSVMVEPIDLEELDEVLESATELAAMDDPAEKQAEPDAPTTHLTAWPNPTHGPFFAKLDGKAEGTVTYRIVSLNGQRIHTLESANEIEEFNLAGHSAGIYYLQATQGGKVWTHEILLQH
jgi:hypothetical protein